MVRNNLIAPICVMEFECEVNIYFLDGGSITLVNSRYSLTKISTHNYVVKLRYTLYKRQKHN